MRETGECDICRGTLRGGQKRITLSDIPLDICKACDDKSHFSVVQNCPNCDRFMWVSCDWENENLTVWMIECCGRRRLE
jgi:hypothetical protein